jgi:uncharacterized protein
VARLRPATAAGPAQCLAASLITGTVWRGYHLPLFVPGSPTRPFALFLPLAISCVIMSVFYTWIYNGTGGSVLLAVLLHAATNLPLTIVYAPLEEHVLPAYRIYVGMLALAAAVLVARAERRRCRAPAARRPRPTDAAARC